MKPKVTLTENMTFMALMAALNAIAALLSAFIPPLAFLFMLVLPLLSVLVVLFCRNKYLFIYIIATIILSLIASIYNIYVTLFYLIPALFTGVTMGILIKKSVNTSITILLTSFLQMGLTYLSIPLIYLLGEINTVEVILQLVKLNDHQARDILVPCFILIISLAQTALTFLIIEDELPKLKIELNNEYLEVSPFISLVAYIIAAIILPFYPPLSYVLLMVVIFFGTISLLQLFNGTKLGGGFLIAGLVLGFISLTIGGLLMEPLYVPFLFAIIFIPADAYLIVKYINNKQNEAKKG